MVPLKCNPIESNSSIMTNLKTQTVMNRIVQVDNFQNMACCCENWLEFTQELEEWGVTGCAKIEFDDPELDTEQLDRFIFAENGYVREVA